MSNKHVGIEKISIRDFRGIDELELSFIGPDGYPTQIVVLAGPNGCGKTAVLEACLLAGGFDKLVRGKVNKEAVRSGCDDYLIEATFRSPDRQWKSEASCGRRGEKYAWFLYFSSWRAPSLVGAVGITAGKKGKRPADTEENRLWLIKQFLVNSRAHELFPGREPSRESGFASAIDELNSVWREFYPDQSFTVEPVSDDPDAGFDLFQVRDDGPRLPVDMLSSGQIELLSFAGWLITKKPSPGIILVDEPELHLDPQWHRQVLRTLVLLNAQCQVVVATHSPEVFDSVRSFERHFLVPADDPRAEAWAVGAAQTEGGS